MKKKLLILALMIVAIVSVFAISVSAEQNPNYGDAYVEKMTSGMMTVTLVDGTTKPLYDDEGWALCYYMDGDTMKSVRAEELVIKKSGTKLSGIELSDGTVLATSSTKANKMVVCNLRHTDITDFASDNLFKNQSVLQYIYMPDTIANLLHYVFFQNTNLIGCYFSENSLLQEIKYFTFSDCKKLKGFYLPKNITHLGRDGSGGTGNNRSAFDGCESIYFVDNYDNDPTDDTKKPSVYYFPSKLVTVSRECFKNCLAINDTIVFPEGVTSIPQNGWTFAYYTSRKNIVFLGDVTELKSCSNTQNIYVYFANEDTTTADTSLTFDKTSDKPSNCKVFFCAEGKVADLANNANWATNLTDMESADHLYLVDKAATCTEEGGKDYSCFCGAKNPEVTPIPALGHTKGDFIELKYDNGFLKVGYYYYKCAACDVESYTYTDKAEYQVPAIFVNNGYSYSGTAILQGFTVNFEALGAYEATGKTVQYGLAVASVAKLGATNTLFDGTTLKEGAFSVSFDDKKQYSIFEMQVTGLVDDYKDAELFVCAYVIDGDTVTYISNGANTSTVEAVTYNEVVANAEANQTTDIIVKKEENV